MEDDQRIKGTVGGAGVAMKVVVVHCHDVFVVGSLETGTTRVSERSS
jgi:hypothetical protein